MHSSCFIYLLSSDHVFVTTPPRLDLWMALSEEPLWTGRTREKGSGLRRCQNGCFEREGMYYTAKTCPKATSHNKRETLKKKKHNKAGQWQDWAKQPASAAAITDLILESSYSGSELILNTQDHNTKLTKKNQRTATRESEAQKPQTAKGGRMSVVAWLVIWLLVHFSGTRI